MIDLGSQLGQMNMMGQSNNRMFSQMENENLMSEQMSQMGMPQMGMPHMGMPQMGMPQMGMPQMGMPQMGMSHMSNQMPQMNNIDLKNLAKLL
jgi:hypothetical protein